MIIAMTFTSVLRGYDAIDEAAYWEIIYPALFCCMAWGIADGLFYAWERRYNIRMENKIIDLSRSGQNRDDAIPLIREQLDDTILRNINYEKRMELYRNLMKYLDEVGIKRILSKRDAISIISATFVISTVAGLAVVSPFFLVENLQTALNISNMLGICLLFVIGYYRAYEKSASARMIMGFGTAVIGMVIAAVTILLGG
ncbi:MAG TPA: VIT1/CCC1 transporter family protein [Methanothrix sp.]|nr:VIT1/CCC1 transporter family protein [Methanothrix sp.]